MHHGRNTCVLPNGLQHRALRHRTGVFQPARTARYRAHRARRRPGTSHDAVSLGGPFRVARVSQRPGPLVLDCFGRQRAGRATRLDRPLPARFDRRAARSAGQCDRGAALGFGPRAVVPLGHGIAPDRIAPDRLRNRRADLLARRAVGSRPVHVAAVAVLPRPRRTASHGGRNRRFLALARTNRRRYVARG